MKRFISLCPLLGGLALLLVTPMVEAVAAPRESAGHRIVYLGDRGPVLIELQLYIDGKPLREAHEALMRKLFDYLDRDGDGVLSAKEAAAVPSATVLSNPLLLARGRLPGNPQRIRTDGEGKVTRAALAAYYRRTGLPALQLSGGAVGTTVFRVIGAPQEASAEKLTDRLFALLDTDKDGKLSRKELEAAPEILGKLDIDEDEMLTTAEVMGEAGGTESYGAVVAIVGGPQTGLASPPLHVVADGGNDPALAKKLLQRYAKKGSTTVEASALGLSREVLAILDPEGNGSLSVTQLAHLGKLPADVTLTVHLGDRGDKPMMSVKGDKRLPEDFKVKATDNGVTLQLGRSRLELGGPTTSTTFAVQLNIRDQIKNLFRQADRENRGYVERKDLGRGNAFSDSFDLIDRDGDGKITEKELLAWFDQMEALRKVVDRSCVSISVSNEGRGLFELLDTNRDGKLSVRELRSAARVLQQLEIRGDSLAREDVPRHYRAALALGPNGGDNPFVRKAFVISRGDMGTRRASPARGPLWFQKMDRNRDGDVSRKEFLGTDEQFRAIDTDGDGLISVAEAEAYDKRPLSREPPARQRRNAREQRRER